MKIRLVAVLSLFAVSGWVLAADVATSSPALFLPREWQQALQKGSLTLSELQRLFGSANASVDLEAHPEIEFCNGIHYLDSVESVCKKFNKPMLQSFVPLNTPGFPESSFHYYAIDGNFEGGYNRLLIVADKKMQVVALEFVDETGRGGNSNDYNGSSNNTRRVDGIRMYDIVRNKVRGISTWQVFYTITDKQDGILILDSVLTGAGSTTVSRPGDPNPSVGSRHVKERVRFIVSKPLVNLVLFRLSGGVYVAPEPKTPAIANQQAMAVPGLPGVTSQAAQPTPEVAMMEKLKQQMVEAGNADGAWGIQQQIDKQSPKVGANIRLYEGTIRFKYRSGHHQTIKIEGEKVMVIESNLPNVSGSGTLEYVSEWDGYLWVDSANISEVLQKRDGVMFAMRFGGLDPRNKKVLPENIGMAKIEMAQSEAKSNGSAKSMTIKIHVDGKDALKIHDGKLWIEHLGWDKPDLILINEAEWKPVWEGNKTDLFKGFVPGLAPFTGPNVNVEKVKGRGDVVVSELPTDKNDHTLIVIINDGPGGADMYEVKLSW